MADSVYQVARRCWWKRSHFRTDRTYISAKWARARCFATFAPGRSIRGSRFRLGGRATGGTGSVGAFQRDGQGHFCFVRWRAAGREGGFWN